MIFDPMREQLTKLAQRLQQDNIKLIVGGGYGLLLKTEYVQQNNLQTRFPDFPTARSTNDIDIFLSTEIITDATKSKTIRDVLTEMGFISIMDYCQFEASINQGSSSLKVRIDLLSTVPDEYLSSVKVDKQSFRKDGKPSIQRIRPKGEKSLPAAFTKEAVTLEAELFSLNLGDASNPLEIFLPHPFTFLILKLFALRDRLEDERKDFGAYHAFDIYRVIAMLTEVEWEQALRLRDQFAAAYVMQDARKIVGELFSSAEATGILRIRQHARKTDSALGADHIESLIADLNELFPKNIDD